MPESNYPANCIKGIPNDTFLIDEDRVAPHLFHFKLDSTRPDGWVEQSINWQDDDSAIEFTLGQTKDSGEQHFKAGATVLPRHEIDRLIQRPVVNGLLSYERDSLPSNPFHGNILLREGVPKPTMKMIAAGLALAVADIILQTGQSLP